MEDLAPQLLKILQIIWINIILSGDNAVVIALACRGLPANRQRMGMVLGAGVAVGAAHHLHGRRRLPPRDAVPEDRRRPAPVLDRGEALVEDEEEQEGKIAETDRLWHAVRTIAIADAVMSLDNVLAIAAVAKDSLFLLILGLAISIPLIVAGAALIMALLARFPIFVWLGAGLLGWVAGEMLITDPWLEGQIGTALVHRLEMPMAALGALFVVGSATSSSAARIRRRRAGRNSATSAR